MARKLARERCRPETLTASDPKPVSANVLQAGGINAQTGTSYTAVNTDCGKLVTLNNASAVAVTLTAAASLVSGFYCHFQNLGAGKVTITPASGTINGGGSISLYKGQGCSVYSDGSNFSTRSNVQTFHASGMDHSTGLVPDPGSTYGTTRYLREDATWGTPSGGGGSSDGTINGGWSQADLVPGSPSTYDDEFNGTSLSSDWTVYDPSSALTLTEDLGVLKMSLASSVTYGGIYQAAPSAPYTFVTKLFVPPVQQNYFFCGFQLYETSSGKNAFYTLGQGGGGWHFYRFYGTSGRFTTDTAAYSYVSNVSMAYLKVENDGTNIKFSASTDGISWYLWQSDAVTSLFTSAPDEFGLGMKDQFGVLECSFDWIRRTA